MINVHVKYKVKSECVEENITALKKFVKGIRENNNGIRYQAFILDDGVTFVHQAQYESKAIQVALITSEHFKEWMAGINNRCVDEKQNVHSMELIDEAIFQ